MTTKPLLKQLCTLGLIAGASLGPGQAATKITYAEIPKHLGSFGTVLAYRGFTVATSDGKKHNGRRLRLESDHLRIFHRDNSYEDLPGFTVTRIEIRQSGRFFHHVVENGTFALLPVLAISFAGPFWAIPGMLVTAPVTAYAAVSTPFFLAADGVAFLIPPKVYEIAP